MTTSQYRIAVTGVTCDSCKRHVSGALRAADAQEASVDASTVDAKVRSP